MSMIDNDYLCPKCKGHLNVSESLVFATRTKKNHKGLILLSHKVGEYKYKHHPKFHLQKGEMVDFECPICQADLTSEKNKDHAMIYMVVEEDNVEYELYFSKIAGKQSTYLVAHDNVETFGEDALDFEDLFYE
jgi:transcription initiation factor IIE alpha subunit